MSESTTQSANTEQNYQNPYDDPLYLSTSDFPGMQLVSTPFNGKNYIHWSRGIMMALGSKNKQGFLTGKTAMPEASSSKHSQWQRCDFMIRCWILNSMSTGVKEGFMTAKSTKQLWNEIFERYGQSNGPLLYKLKKDLRNISQNDSNVAEYFTNLKRRWDDIEELESIPECSCGVMEKCTCNILKKMLQLASQEKVLTFLMGLNDCYDTLRTNILSMEPLPSINKAYSFVQQIESQKNITNILQSSQEVSAMASERSFINHSGGSNSGGWHKDAKRTKVDDRWCSFCRKTGHVKDTCFKLHPEQRLNYQSRNPTQRYTGHKFAANVSDVVEDTPFEVCPDKASTTQGIQKFDPALVTAVYHQMMSMLQSDQRGESVNHAAINFAGKILASNAMSYSNSHNNLDWIVDSGATDHMSAHKDLFLNLRSLPKPILVGLPDGSTKRVTQIGEISLHPQILLHEVLYIPDFKHNLLSVGRLLSANCLLIHFDMDKCILQDLDKQTLIVGLKDAGLYKIRSEYKEESLAHNDCNSAHMSSSLQCTVGNRCKAHSHVELLHSRLGHTSSVKMSHLPEINKADLQHFTCETCVQAKMHRLSFDRDTSRAQNAFDLVHIDLWGPYKAPTLTGAHYFLTLVDDHTRTTWTFLLKEKTQVPSTLQHFINQATVQFGKQIKRIRSDNGTEIIQHTCQQMFSQHGILHQKSAPGVPQQNGRVERKHRHLVETARALLLNASLPKKFWGECVLAVTHIINRLPTHILGWKTPYQLLLGKAVDYEELRVIGCLCFALVQSGKRDKFEAKGRRCMFIGYPYGQKAYKLYDLETHKVFISRDVVFHEHTFPFARSLPQAEEAEEVLSTDILFPSYPQFVSHDNTSTNMPPSNNTIITNNAHNNIPDSPCSSQNSYDSLTHNSIIDGGNNSMSSLDTSSSATHAPSGPTASQMPVRHSNRPIVVPSKYKDFVCPTLQNRSHAVSDSSLSFTVLDLSTYPRDYLHSLHNAMTVHEPTSYLQAKNDPNWVSAMSKELEALEANGTWELCSLPTGFKAIGSKWVYKVKFKPDGTVERYKARLVAKGYNQVEGRDFTHTFSPVAKFSTVRVLLAVAAAKQWPIYQLDINNAFLHGFLDEEVYMQPPEGYIQANSGQVCRLKRSLYGLKQASRQWNHELTKLLLKQGFQQSRFDYSLFSREQDGFLTMVLVYVDDLLLTGNDPSYIAVLKKVLDTTFTIKDLGYIRYFLGLEVIRSSEGILVNQRKYVRDLISDAGMNNCSPAPFPLPRGLKLTIDDGVLLSDPEVYRKIIGKLLYLNLTRPDISYAVQHLSQYMSSPREPHLQAAVHVIRYLKGTSDAALLYPADNELILQSFCDADWGACQFSCRSLTGQCTFLGNSLISWKTKKQPTVSKSSAESEYRAMSYTAGEIVWLHGLLSDFRVIVPLPITLHCDNKAAQHIAANPVFHERTKHLNIDCHYVRERVQEGVISTAYIRSSNQLADLFTKPLGIQQHRYLSSKLGLQFTIGALPT
ncbi:hypothetical protein vseg_007105 [Gypsophila vaccaria]